MVNFIDLFFLYSFIVLLPCFSYIPSSLLLLVHDHAWPSRCQVYLLQSDKQNTKLRNEFSDFIDFNSSVDNDIIYFFQSNLKKTEVIL